MMDCTPEQAKDFVMELQVHIANLLERKDLGMSEAEITNLANEVVDYAFALMLKTHRGQSLKTPKVDDDIPF